MSLVAAPRLPQAAALPSPPTAAVFVVMLGAMCFHMALCFVNTKVGGVGNSALIGSEIAILGTVLMLSYPAIDYARFLVVGGILLYVVALAATRTAVQAEPLGIKPVRDLLIPIAFFYFGMRSADIRRADRLVAIAAGIAVTVGLVEYAFPDRFTDAFNIAKFYVDRGTMHAGQSPQSSNLFISGMRPDALGGRNLAIEYMGPHPLKRRWRDLGGVIEGPAVRLLDEIFLADWAFASGQPLARLQKELPAEIPAVAGTSELQIVASGPDVSGDALYEGILSLVQQAESSVWIVTPYFIPDEVLFRSLLVQARAGIDVRLVVPARSNHPITDLARKYYLRGLQAAGVKVLLYGPGMIHAKMLLVDGETGLFGSANMDLRSLFLNFEIGAVTYSPGEAHAIAEWMKEIFAHSRPMPESPRETRLFPSIGEEIARLLAPLL